LDLSLKSSKEILPQIDQEEQNIDNDNDEETSDESSTVIYLCSVCPYKHSNWAFVQRHISLHLNGQGIVCSFCPYTTSSHNSMIRHMTTIHSTSQITTKFQHSSQILNAHIIEQHQCSLCSYQCDRSEALNLHRRLEHDDEEFDIDSSDDEDDITASTTKNIFDCPLCSPSSNTNNYTNLEQLTMHAITNHNNQSCPFCSFIAHATSSHTLTQHVKLHFNGTLVQPDPIVGIEQVKELLMLE
jgi:DNA-directed RNA polymerase subunit M/transcription elongation factor TFIIS